MKSFLKSKKIIYIMLALIIAAGICRFSYGFFVQKQGTHSDEEWSFGLANSYYEPYIYSSDDSQYTKNVNEWLSGDVLKDYLTVQDGERFSFGSVFYNMSCDTHPPLYFCVLHFLSSFFVDQYIPALGFVINMVCYIFISIYLYKLAYLMCKSGYAALGAVIFNTFTVGTLSMMIYLRNYTMVTMFGVILAYLTAKLFYVPESREKKSTYVSMAAITCLGALTHHFFLPYAFIITVIICIYWMIKRNWRTLFKYAACMLIGVIISIAIFPATLDHTLGIVTFEYRDAALYTESCDTSESLASGISTATDENIDISGESASTVDWTSKIDNYEWKLFKYYFWTCMQMVLRDTLGFSPVSPFKQGIAMYIPIVLLICAAIFAAASFLFRKDSWFIKFKATAVSLIKNLPHKFVYWLKSFSYFFPLALIASIATIIIICSLKVNVSGMGSFTTRYMFIVYPLFHLIIYYIVCILFHLIFKAKPVEYCSSNNNPVSNKHRLFQNSIVYVVFICILISNNLLRDCSYFHSDNYSVDLVTDTVDSADVIVISDLPWYLTVYAPLIYNCNEFYYTSYYDFQQNLSNISKSESDVPLYIIVDTDNTYDSSDLLNSQTSSKSIEASTVDDLSMQTLREERRLAKDYLNLDNILENAASLSDDTAVTYIGDAKFFDMDMSIYRIK